LSGTPTRFLTVFLLSLLAGSGIAVAQPPAPVPPAAAPPSAAPPADSQPSDRDFEKGSFHWRLLGGASLPIDYKDSSSDRKMAVLAVDFGRIMTRRHGPGPLAGQFEWVLQAEPIVVRGPEHFNGVGLAPILLRWTFAGGKQVRPIAEIGSGFMLIKWPDPASNQVLLNFYEQIGFGVRFGRPWKPGGVIGFKYQHISNGGRAKPSTGTDAYIVYGGVSFPHKPYHAASASPAGGPGEPAVAPQPAQQSRAQGLSFSGGTGLITGVVPDTLDRGKWAIGAFEMNYDRNPGDVDVMKFSFQYAFGLTKRAEVFVGYTPVVRTNAVNLDPLDYPVPPLDLVVDTYPTVADRAQPYFLYPQEVPYKTYDFPTTRVVPPSWGAFSQSSGNIAVGGKVSLLSENRGNPLGLGVQGYVEIPTEHPEGNTANWAHLSGVAGATDVGVRLALEKRLKGTQLVGNVGYKWTGTPDLGGIRIQYVDSSRAGTAGFVVGAPVTVPLKLYDELSFTAGARVPVFTIAGDQSWLIGEVSYTRYVGGGTPVERLLHLTEVRLGLQSEIPGYPKLMIGAAWQYPLGHMGNGDFRTSNFTTPDGKGDINFGQLVNPQLASAVGAFFAQNGVTLAANTSKVFATNNAAFDNWRNVKPSAQPVSAQGNNAILAFITWRFR
jgi:hypothetical protein